MVIALNTRIIEVMVTFLPLSKREICAFCTPILSPSSSSRRTTTSRILLPKSPLRAESYPFSETLPLLLDYHLLAIYDVDADG